MGSREKLLEAGILGKEFFGGDQPCVFSGGSIILKISTGETLFEFGIFHTHLWRDVHAHVGAAVEGGADVEQEHQPAQGLNLAAQDERAPVLLEEAVHQGG